MIVASVLFALVAAAPCRAVTPTPVRWLLTGREASAPVEAPPIPESLAFRVAFWERIWGELDAGQFLLVDERRPWVVHAELDCRSSRATRTCAKEEAKRDAIARMKRGSERDLLYGRHSKLARDAKNHLIFVEGRKNDLFKVLDEHADDVATAEAMFDVARVPREYARLAVVESMMRSDAVSSAGATGTYQLMPLIASRYLFVRDGVDERLDPVRSSLAAAKYLKQLRSEVGSWPHALTAYNTGPARLRKLMKKHRTKDVGKLVDAAGADGVNDGFGWASQNYCAKVVAVANVTRERVLERNEHEDIAVRVDRKMKLSELAACVDLAPEELVAANPSLTGPIVAGKKPVPKGYFALVRRSPPVVLRR